MTKINNRFITSKPNKFTIIKGAAGTGKTTLSLLRLSFLLNNYCQENDDKVLMITKNRLLKSYSEFKYKEISSSQPLTLFSFLNRKEKIISLGELKNQLIADNEEMKFTVLKDKALKLQYLLKAMDKGRKVFKRAKLLKNDSYAEFVLEEIAFIKTLNIASLKDYQEIKRYRNLPYDDSVNKYIMRKNSLAREVIYTIRGFYDEMLLQDGFIDEEDKTLKAIKAVTDRNLTFTHIIAEDIERFTKAEIDLIKALSAEKGHSTVSLTLRNDYAIKSYSYIGKGRNLKAMGVVGKNIILKEVYRTSFEISQFANGLTEKTKKRYLSIKSNKALMAGDYPIHRNFKDYREEYLYIVRLIKDELLRKYKGKEIVVLSRDLEALNKFKMYLFEGGIPYNFLLNNEADFSSNKVNIAAFNTYQGLESKVTIILGVTDNNYNSEEDRKLLYNMILTAKEKLYFTSSGKPSRFLDEVNHKLFKLDDRQYIASGMEHYTFMDLQRKKRFDLLRDISISKNLSIKNQDSYIELDEKAIKRIPVYNNIAAGSPILMNDEETGSFFLPKELLSKNKEFFMVKISGDSMINAKICNGDLVIVERGTQIENMEIGAVAVGDEATLKRVKIKGNSVTLISENDNYPPMLMHINDIRILGKAVAVVKKM